MDSERPQPGQHHHRCVRPVHAVLAAERESSEAHTQIMGCTVVIVLCLLHHRLYKVRSLDYLCLNIQSAKLFLVLVIFH